MLVLQRLNLSVHRFDAFDLLLNILHRLSPQSAKTLNLKPFWPKGWAFGNALFAPCRGIFQAFSVSHSHWAGNGKRRA